MGDPITCPLEWRVCSPGEPCYLCMKAQRDAALMQIKAFEDAKAKDLEALMDLLEVMSPFYLHAKALRGAGRLETNLNAISKQGVSTLNAGAFVSAIETFEKWGEVAGMFAPNGKDD